MPIIKHLSTSNSNEEIYNLSGQNSAHITLAFSSAGRDLYNRLYAFFRLWKSAICVQF